MHTKEKFIVKQLTAKDVNLFQELIHVFEDVFEMQNFSIPDDNHLQKLLDKPDFMAFAGLADNKVVGGLTAYILTSYFTAADDVYILDLAVKKEFQRMGLGKKLMETVINHCKSQNMNVLFVQTDEIDKYAVDFYSSLGGIPEKAINFDYPLT